MTKENANGRFTGWNALLLASTALSGVALSAAPAVAQEATTPATTTATGGLDVIIVTAQKRAQNLQDVPISVQALQGEQLEQLNVTDFTDYAKYLPSLSFSASYGPGYNRPYMRGVASGENGNHSASSPSVGMYLDEQPITTITGSVDLHVYDIARVEVLAGPQGTLYGASSEAGTVRIITNQPDPSHMEGGYDFEANTVDHGGIGYTGEGFINIPLNSRAAIRLVGWDEHDAGYIDNVHTTRFYPTAGVTADNADRVDSNYNTASTIGGRAALRIDLNDNWTVTPQIMGQVEKTHGVFAEDPAFGSLAVAHFLPEYNNDSWTQGALTVHGLVSNFDVVFTSAYLHRSVDSDQDYADYSYFYDVLYGSYVTDNAGDNINPAQLVEGRDKYDRQSYEFRVSSPTENRLRVVGGLFYQMAKHHIHQRYVVDNLADASEVPGWPDTIWLTQQLRTDEEAAVFGEVSFDITDKLTATGGARFFHTNNSLEGFFGYGAGFSTSQGEATCFEPSSVEGAPCNDLDRTSSKSGDLYRANLQYQIDADRMIYATYSEGFRPGGINRRDPQPPLAPLPPYEPDYLNNYEIGWKTQWDEGRLRWNGAIFLDEWKAFQYSFLPPGSSGLTQIQNAGDAEIKGIESDVAWAPIDHLTINGSITLLHAELTNATIADTTKGTRMPISPEVKGDVTARYEFQMGDNWNGFLQGSAAYQGDSTLDLRTSVMPLIGTLPSFWLFDASAGVEHDGYTFSIYVNNLTDERAQLSRYVECTVTTCFGEQYDVVARPRTLGVKIGHRF